MSWDFKALEVSAQTQIAQANSLPVLEAIRQKYLGRKGLIAQIYSSLAGSSAEEKPRIGKGANELKDLVTGLLQTKQTELRSQEKSEVKALDVSLPGVSFPLGRPHILTQTIDEICTIFERLGFVVEEGPEIENEFNNFTALNIPVDHPARDAFDTFYLDVPDPQNPGRYLLLRSHTSPGQIHVMKKYRPPLAVVIPGRVYRPDAVDASHCFMFHQIEGLLVDDNVKFSDLKGMLETFCRHLFGEKIRLRLRPHFFPFTEPSADVDISCYLCDGKGCSVCKKKGWLEVMGCGLVHPKVFEAVGYPKGKYTGLAFGMGVERLAMLKHGISDIRLFFENDLRFLKQF